MPSRAAQVAASPCFHSKAVPEPHPGVTDLIHTPCSQLTQLALVTSSPCSASPGPHMHSPPVTSSPSTTLSSVNVCFPKVLSWEGRLVRQHTSAGNTLLAHPAAEVSEPKAQLTVRPKLQTLLPHLLGLSPLLFPALLRQRLLQLSLTTGDPTAASHPKRQLSHPTELPAELVQSLRAEGCCMVPALHLPVSKACWFISATQSSSANSKASWGL